MCLKCKFVRVFAVVFLFFSVNMFVFRDYEFLKRTVQDFCLLFLHSQIKIFFFNL